ncbi:hypothetical protein IL306_000461 [Fusarium sp. DS 682]|nr:hypothetical protein IL306_000461 [Fusarium sp. DS 682]
MAANASRIDIAEFGEEIHHIELGWLHVIKIMAALLNWQWQPVDSLSKRVWNPYACRVRTMEFDFFNQRLVIGDTQIVKKPCPKLLTLDETSDLIEKKFGPDVSIGMIPDLILVNSGYGPGTRRRCDLCYMQPHNIALAGRCNERKALKTVRGQGDLVYLPRDRYPIRLTASPPNLFQYLEMEEISGDEPIENDDGQEGDEFVEKD